MLGECAHQRRRVRVYKPGNAGIPALHTVTHTFSMACFCASSCGILCLWVCDRACVCSKESEETLKSLEGDFLWKGKLFLLPLSDTLLPSLPPSLSLSLSLSLSHPQTLRVAWDTVKEKWKRSWRINRRPDKFCCPLCNNARKLEDDCSCFAIETTRCHVDVLHSTPVVDALNMASLSAQSPGRLSREDYLEQKWKSVLPDRGETPAKMVK